MATVVEQIVGRSRAKLLAGEEPTGLVIVLATFAAYFALDRWTRLIAVVDRDDLGRPSLVAAAVADRWWALVPLIVVAVAGLRWRSDRVGARWSDLQHGTTLRVGAGVVIGLLAWQAALYDVNFLAGRAHPLDRVLVVVLAAAAVWRPAFIVPFTLAVRIVNEQFLHPFGTQAAKNVDELLVIALLAIVAGHVVYVITARNDTASVLLIIGSAIAAHFFWPGKGKIVMSWLSLNDVSNLPLSSYTAGWLGGTDGGVARFMSDLFASFRLPVLATTLVIEAGAVLAVLHPKLLRVWLPAFVGFHVMTFITTGFFFLGWALLEIGLLVVLVLPRFAHWVAVNATPARGLIAAAAVVGGPVLFHPPGLAWFDSPVAYGYRIEAVGESGAAYHVPISAFAPLDQDISFSRLQLADRLVASGGYGALSTVDELERLRAITTFEELRAYEKALGEPPPADESHRFFIAFFDHVNRGDHRTWWGLGPPDRFWTGREEPTFDFDEPLRRLEVYLVSSIHGDGDQRLRRELVLVIETGVDGRGVVVTSAADG